jgi:hypothetical protein
LFFSRTTARETGLVLRSIGTSARNPQWIAAVPPLFENRMTPYARGSHEEIPGYFAPDTGRFNSPGTRSCRAGLLH